MIILDIVKNLYTVYDHNLCVKDLVSKVSKTVQKVNSILVKSHTLEQIQKDIETYIRQEKISGVLLKDSIKKTVMSTLRDTYCISEFEATQKKYAHNINCEDLYRHISFMTPTQKVSLDKFYTFFIVELPFMIHSSINNAYHQNKELYDREIIESNCTEHRPYLTNLSDIHNIKELTGINAEDVLFDLKELSSRSEDLLKILVSKSNNGLLTIIEHIIKNKRHIDTDAFTLDKKSYKQFLINKSLSVDDSFTDFKHISRAIDISKFNFNDDNEKLSRYKIKKVEEILDQKGVVNTLWLMLSIYLLSIRQTLKRDVPDSAISTNNVPIEIDYYLAISSYDIALKIIDFIKKNMYAKSSSIKIPSLTNFIYLLQQYTRGGIKSLICATCGQPYFVINNDTLHDLGTNLLRFRCPICTSNKKTMSSNLVMFKDSEQLA